MLVIDDMLALGWNKVIVKLFETQSSGSVTDYSSISALCDKSSTPHVLGAAEPDVLLTALGWCKDETVENGTADCTKYVQRCYDSPIYGGNARPWMLVLDLMLFSGRATEEKNWLKKLFEVANKVSETDKLSRPGFTEDELKIVGDWLKGPGGFDDPAYGIALSLFPRLCALRWPSVPILLFSATGRRELVAGLVERYRNIFDAPAKPDLLRGDIGENVKAFNGGWRERIVEAQRLIAVQRRLVGLLSDDAGGNQFTASNAQHRHLTIALDESGNFGRGHDSAIGGVIIEARSNSRDGAKTLTNCFLEQLRAMGINFYDHPPVYTDDRGKFQTS